MTDSFRITEIAPGAKRLADHEFVYLLTGGGEVVYVGRTQSLGNRMSDLDAARHFPKELAAVLYSGR
jgi:hypothetical protein